MEGRHHSCFLFSNWGKRINRCEVRGAPPYLIKYIESHWGGGAKPMDP